MFENPRRGRQARNFTKNVPKILDVKSSSEQILGNLRTTTKFTTTTSVDWEKTGTRTSVSAGKRILKMQSTGRSTTTPLNVNTNVKLWCSFTTKFFAMASFKTMQDFIFQAVRLISLTMNNFLRCLTFSRGKNTCFPYEDYSTFNLSEMTESERLSE